MDFENRIDHLLDVRHLRSGDVSGTSVEELLDSIIHEVSELVTAVTLNATAARQALTIDPPDLTIARSAAQCLNRDSRDLVQMVKRLHPLFSGVKPDKTSLHLKRFIDRAQCLFAAILLEAKGEAAALIEDDMLSPPAGNSPSVSPKYAACLKHG